MKKLNTCLSLYCEGYQNLRVRHWRRLDGRKNNECVSRSVFLSGAQTVIVEMVYLKRQMAVELNDTPYVDEILRFSSDFRLFKT